VSPVNSTHTPYADSTWLMQSRQTSSQNHLSGMRSTAANSLQQNSSAAQLPSEVLIPDTNQLTWGVDRIPPANREAPGNKSDTIRECNGKNSSAGIDEDGRQRSMSGNVDKNIPDDTPTCREHQGKFHTKTGLLPRGSLGFYQLD